MGSIFLVNLPIVVVALVAGRALVPPSKDPHPRALDPTGAFMSVAGVLAVVYAIIEAPSNGWLSPTTLGVLAAGLLVLTCFVIFELRSSHPMVDLRIFKNARFSAASFAMTMIFLALFGWLFLFTQQLQFVLGYDTLQAGVRALPFALTIGIVPQPAAKAAARIGTKAVVAVGLALMAVGFGLIATSTVHTGYSFLLPASVIIAAGMGLAMAPATESIMGSLPVGQAGVGSAVNDATRSLGGALGVAILGSVSSSVFAQRVNPFLAHVPAGYVAQAKSSVGATLALAHRAPGPFGHLIAAGARQAFISGSDKALLGAVGVSLIGAVVSALFLPARALAESHATRAPEPAFVELAESVA